ncbi:MAG: hypothetical protein WCF03_10095 [Nitrososphaeraceae archaeon]|jgi:hypothetical protein
MVNKTNSSNNNSNNKNNKHEDVKERTSSEFLSLYNQLKAINLSVENDTPTIISVLATRLSVIGCTCSYDMIHSVPQQFCLSCKVLTPINDELLEAFSDLVEYSALIEKQYQEKDG